MSKIGIVATMAGMFGSVFNWAKGLFGGRGNNFKPQQDPYKRKTRTENPGRRKFQFVGTDGLLYFVRVGKPFPRRPHLSPDMVIATWDNRLLLEVKW